MRKSGLQICPDAVAVHLAGNLLGPVPIVLGEEGQSFCGYFGLLGLRQRAGAVKYPLIAVFARQQVILTVALGCLLQQAANFLIGCRLNLPDGACLKEVC